MGDGPMASEWATATFGQEADQLVEIIPLALLAAHNRARQGQLGVRTATLEAYGHGLHAAQYESLAESMAAIPGTSGIKLNGRDIVLLKQHAFYPLRMPRRSGHLKRISSLRRRLFDRYGPDPLQGELEWEWEGQADMEEIQAGVSGLPDDVRLVVLAYVCTMDLGLTELRWGHAELLDDGSLRWHDSESLPLAWK
jgi:hypothetical protein